MKHRAPQYSQSVTTQEQFAQISRITAYNTLMTSTRTARTSQAQFDRDSWRIYANSAGAADDPLINAVAKNETAKGVLSAVTRFTNSAALAPADFSGAVSQRQAFQNVEGGFLASLHMNDNTAAAVAGGGLAVVLFPYSSPLSTPSRSMLLRIQMGAPLPPQQYLAVVVDMDSLLRPMIPQSRTNAAFVCPLPSTIAMNNKIEAEERRYSQAIRSASHLPPDLLAHHITMQNTFHQRNMARIAGDNLGANLASIRLLGQIGEHGLTAMGAVSAASGGSIVAPGGWTPELAVGLMATDLGTRYNNSTRAALDDRSTFGLSQAATAKVLSAIFARKGLTTGGTHSLQDGQLLLLPSMTGERINVIAIRSDGAAYYTNANIRFDIVSGIVTVTNVGP